MVKWKCAKEAVSPLKEIFFADFLSTTYFRFPRCPSLSSYQGSNPLDTQFPVSDHCDHPVEIGMWQRGGGDPLRSHSRWSQMLQQLSLSSPWGIQGTTKMTSHPSSMNDAWECSIEIFNILPHSLGSQSRILQWPWPPISHAVHPSLGATAACIYIVHPFMQVRHSAIVFSRWYVDI